MMVRPTLHCDPQARKLGAMLGLPFPSLLPPEAPASCFPPELAPAPQPSHHPLSAGPEPASCSASLLPCRADTVLCTACGVICLETARPLH